LRTLKKTKEDEMAAAVDKSLGGVGEPASYAAAITPSDNDDLPVVSRAIYVGGAGNLVVTMLGGGDITFTAVLAGTIIPIRVTRVKTSTATALVNLY
jgi:hypothetical protein